MEVTARVVGIRLWDRDKKPGIRHVTIEWRDEKTEENQYPVSYTAELKDLHGEFCLGDEVIVNFVNVTKFTEASVKKGHS